MPVDLGQLYRYARLRITDLVSDQEGDRPVAATPLWTVHDVVAHMAGVMEDVRTGKLEGVTTDPWTAAQIERGRSKGVSELLDQWTQDAAGPEAFFSTPEGAPYFRAVVDVMTHLADLLTAFGRPVDLPTDFLNWIAPQFIESFKEEAELRRLPVVDVEAPDFEVFRGRLGRRTEGRGCGVCLVSRTRALPRHLVYFRASRAFDWRNTGLGVKIPTPSDFNCLQ